jgi:hypothetical protein
MSSLRVWLSEADNFVNYVPPPIFADLTKLPLMLPATLQPTKSLGVVPAEFSFGKADLLTALGADQLFGQ